MGELLDLIAADRPGLRRQVQEAEHQSFTPSALQLIRRPCVYIFWKDDKPLYIGKSQNGALRFADPGHHRAAVRDMADKIGVLWFKNTADAERIEKHLIKELSPPYNANRNGRIPDFVFAGRPQWRTRYTLSARLRHAEGVARRFPKSGKAKATLNQVRREWDEAYDSALRLFQGGSQEQQPPPTTSEQQQ